MKQLRIILGVLLFSGVAWADINVTQGSGKTVATTTDNASREFQNVIVSTMNIRNGTGVLAPVGYDTAVSSSMPVNIQAGSIANTSFLAMPGASNLVITSTANISVKIADVGATGVPIVSTNTLNVKIADVGATGVPIVSSTTLNVSAAQSGTWTVQPGNTANTTAWKVDGSAVTQPVSGTVTVLPGASNLVVTSTSAISTTVANSTISTNGLVLVSSNTVLPTASGDATKIQTMGDAYGRLVTIAGVPTAIQSSTSPAPITNTSTVVLVSSPSATTFVHMCGCTLGNSSTTNIFATIFLRGDLTSSGSKRMMVPANNFPTGWAMNCATPFLNGRGGEQIAIQASASVSSLYVDCLYYTSTVP